MYLICFLSALTYFTDFVETVIDFRVVFIILRMHELIKLRALVYSDSVETRFDPGFELQASGHWLAKKHNLCNDITVTGVINFEEGKFDLKMYSDLALSRPVSISAQFL